MKKVIEHPIIFNADMVRAILDGRKTQTRRVIKNNVGGRPYGGAYFDAYNGGPQWNWWTRDNRVCNGSPIIKCPYGKIGDELWVRESFGIYKPGSTIKQSLPLFEYIEPDSNGDENDQYIAAMDGRMRVETGRDLLYRAGTAGLLIDGVHWRPSIHMPRWASRIQLRIKTIRVERVQDINEKDALDEGVLSPWDGMATDRAPSPDPVEKFTALWDSINAKRGFGWDDNPWVWVLEFERINND